MPFILENDWTFITANGIDFRGPSANPGGKGLYAGVPLHAGLICLESVGDFDAAIQLAMFELAVHTAATLGGLINTLLDLTHHGNRRIELRRFQLPRLT